MVVWGGVMAIVAREGREGRKNKVLLML